MWCILKDAEHSGIGSVKIYTIIEMLGKFSSLRSNRLTGFNTHVTRRFVVIQTALAEAGLQHTAKPFFFVFMFWHGPGSVCWMPPG